jgi:hypothetical protein
VITEPFYPVFSYFYFEHLEGSYQIEEVIDIGKLNFKEKITAAVPFSHDFSKLKVL